MEAFKVWTSLEIKGNGPKQMEKFAAATSVAAKHAKSLSLEMKSLNQRFLILDNRLAKLVPYSENLVNLFRGLNTSTRANNQSFAAWNMQLNRSNTSTSVLTEKTASLTQKVTMLDESIRKVAIDSNLAAGGLERMGSASKIGRVAGMGAGVSSGGRRGGGGGHVPYHALSHMGLGPAGSIGAGLGAAARFGGPVAIGALAVGIALHQGYEKNVEYTKELAQFKALGFSDSQIADVQNFTSGTMSGISPIQQIKALRDAQMSTRKYSDAKLLAPDLAKFKFIADSMFSGISDQGLQDAIRISDIRGGADPKKIKNELNTVMQMFVTSGGSISPTKYLPFFTGYQGSNRISPEGLLALEPTLQEYKPVSAAKALQTLYGQLQGGVKLTERNESFFEKIGLFKGGKLVAKYGKDLATDPEAFFEKDWLPMLARNGITSPEGIAQANIHLGRTPSQFFSILGKNTEKASRARAQAPGLLGIDQLFKKGFQTESGSALRFMQALESLTLAFGKASSPAVIAVLNSLSYLVEHLSKAIPSGWAANKEMANALTPRTTGTDGKPILPWLNPSTWFHKENKSQDIHITLAIDGQKFAKFSAKYMSDAFTRGGTQSAPNGVNPMMTPQPAGINNFGAFN